MKAFRHLIASLLWVGVIAWSQSVTPSNAQATTQAQPPSGNTVQTPVAVAPAGSPSTAGAQDAASAAKQVIEVRQVIGGDFCLEDSGGQCTTELLKPDAKAEDKLNGYVSDAAGSAVDLASVSLAADVADITFKASADFKPLWLVLSRNHHSYKFAFAPAPPLENIQLVFASDDLPKICEPPREGGTYKKDAQGQFVITDSKGNYLTDCDHTTRDDLVFKDLSGSNQSQTDFVAIQNHLLFTKWRGHMGAEPYATIVTNKHTNLSIVARRTIKPGQNLAQLNIDMTIMDQTTASRNYGNRIAKRYLLVNLDVRNPGDKKLQFNKSALYFDVDYVEADKACAGKICPGRDFLYPLATVSTLGLWQPSPYEPQFVAMGRPEPGKHWWQSDHRLPPREARFGLEQNVKHSPISYLAALGSFDATAEKTDADLKAVELVASVLSNIATGGLVADRSGRLAGATAVLASTFLPGVRGIVLNTSEINRLRANLVSQTLQETVQVSPHGSTSTIVLLPREGILSFTDAEVPVMIKRVLDVHAVVQVVTELPETSVEKGQCRQDYTKEQARLALGEPTGVTTNPNGTSEFTFSKGPVASADFDADGKLTTCKPRSASEQLDAATTLADANQILTNLGLTAANKIELTDGSTVLAGVPGVSRTYHFDAKGNRTTDYTFAFDEIKAEVGKKKSDLDTLLETKASALQKDRSDVIAALAKSVLADAKATTDKPVRYPSPDIKDGFVVVTFANADGKPGRITDDSTVQHVAFEGPQPGTPQ